MSECIFCHIDPERIIVENDTCVAVYDQFPVSEGHVLILTKAHRETLFMCTPEEQLGILDMIQKVKKIIQEKYHPNGYNIGVNIGAAAGQTIRHCHIHIIPRYLGDMKDPRGGVRGVIPGKQNYCIK